MGGRFRGQSRGSPKPMYARSPARPAAVAGPAGSAEFCSNAGEAALEFEFLGVQTSSKKMAVAVAVSCSTMGSRNAHLDAWAAWLMMGWPLLLRAKLSLHAASCPWTEILNVP